MAWAQWVQDPHWTLHLVTCQTLPQISAPASSDVVIVKHPRAECAAITEDDSFYEHRRKAETVVHFLHLRGRLFCVDETIPSSLPGAALSSLRG